MISRYQRNAMRELWSLESQYASWLEVELAVVEAQAEMGLIPEGAAKEIVQKAGFDPERIAQIEEKTRHDVIAFVTNVEERVGPAARFFHFGLTSSDVLDTALALRLAKASQMILEDLERLVEALAKRAVEHKSTPVIGRSHGVHAEPTTFGLKLASFLSEFQRDRERLKDAAEGARAGKISGPVGNYSAASISPALEERALAKLGLRPAPVSTQIVSRDCHAWLFQALAITATTAERLAVEIRHLARTEVGEVEEPFGKGQKGSSAMPHKKNPILSENISGLARLVRSYAQAAMEDVPLWHERDISHSSVERVIAPDATSLADFILARMAGLVEGLVVRPGKMLANLNLTGGLFHSQEVMLRLVKSGLSRVDAYAIVQKRALAAAGGEGGFKALLLSDPDVMERIGPEGLEEIFEGARFSRYATEIFKRLGLE